MLNQLCQGGLIVRNYICVFFLVISALSTFPNVASGKEHKSSGQLLLNVTENIPLDKENNWQFLAQGTFLFDITSSTQQLFGYFGPQFSFGNTSIWLLGGGYFFPNCGLSALGSIWVEHKMLENKLSVFLESDAYFPVRDKVDEEPTMKQYYILGVVNYAFTGWKLGITTEQFFTKDAWLENAIGPTLTINKVTFWLAYDLTPEDNKANGILLRVIFNP